MADQPAADARTQTRMHDELKQIKLPNAMRLDRASEVVCGRILRASGVHTAADLANMRFEAWLQPATGIEHRTIWACQVIKFMAVNGLEFADLNPSAVFKTPIKEDDPLIDVRTYNCLTRAGLIWVEILPYFREEDFLDVRNFGHKSLDRLKNILMRENLELRSTDGR